MCECNLKRSLGPATHLKPGGGKRWGGSWTCTELVCFLFSWYKHVIDWNQTWCCCRHHFHMSVSVCILGYTPSAVGRTGCAREVAKNQGYRGDGQGGSKSEYLCNSLSFPSCLSRGTSESPSITLCCQCQTDTPAPIICCFPGTPSYKCIFMSLSEHSYDSDHRCYTSCIYVFFKWYLEVSSLHCRDPITPLVKSGEEVFFESFFFKNYFLVNEEKVSVLRTN